MTSLAKIVFHPTVFFCGAAPQLDAYRAWRCAGAASDPEVSLHSTTPALARTKHNHIVNGRQPRTLSAMRLMRLTAQLSADWSAQSALLAFGPELPADDIKLASRGNHEMASERYSRHSRAL